MRIKAHPRYKQFKEWCARQRPNASLVKGECYRVAGPRHATAGEIVAGVGANKAGGRWNAPGAMNVVYLSTDAITATAEAVEHYRYYRIAQSKAMPKVIVAVEVFLPAVFDLTDPTVQTSMPVPLADLLAEDWRAVMNAGGEATTQAVGRAAYAAKLSGLIVPSRARPDGVNVVVFPQRLGKNDVLRVLNPDQLENLGKPA